MSETELCKKIRKFGVPTLRKCLFRVNNRPFGQPRSTTASPRITDILAKNVCLPLQSGSKLAVKR